MLWLLSGTRSHRKKVISVLTHSVLLTRAYHSIWRNAYQKIQLMNWWTPFVWGTCVLISIIIRVGNPEMRFCKMEHVVLPNGYLPGKLYCTVRYCIHDRVWITGSLRVADCLPCQLFFWLCNICLISIQTWYCINRHTLKNVTKTTNKWRQTDISMCKVKYSVVLKTL